MSKISNSAGRNDHFLAKARKLSVLPTSLDIFDIRQHYMRILYILLLLVFFFFFRESPDFYKILKNITKSVLSNSWRIQAQIICSVQTTENKVEYCRLCSIGYTDSGERLRAAIAPYFNIYPADFN